MKTEHLQATQPGAIERAAELLRAGQLVAFPTDTIYGVGGDAFDTGAIDALYHVKERPQEKGIPILLADVEALEQVARDLRPCAHSLIERFWPGPLTIIVLGRRELPPNLSPSDTIAVRIPASEVARSLIRAAGGAIATSSANISGEAPAQSGREALAALSGRVAAVVDAGRVEQGVPSTIVDCTVDPPRLLRAGALSVETLDLPSLRAS